VACDTQASREQSNNTQYNHHITVTSGYACILARIKSIFETHDFKVWVVGYDSQTLAYIGYAVKNDSLPHDID